MTYRCAKQASPFTKGFTNSVGPAVWCHQGVNRGFIRVDMDQTDVTQICAVKPKQ